MQNNALALSLPLIWRMVHGQAGRQAGLHVTQAGRKMHAFGINLLTPLFRLSELGDMVHDRMFLHSYIVNYGVLIFFNTPTIAPRINLSLALQFVRFPFHIGL